MTPRLTLDRYVYEDIYPAFKEATDEKEITAKLSRDFLNYLAQRNLILAGKYSGGSRGYRMWSVRHV